MARRKTISKDKSVTRSIGGSADDEADSNDESLPAPLNQVVGYLLRQAHAAFSAHWQLSFRAKGVSITPVQGGMLVLISRNVELTQAALARVMNVEGPTLLQSLDRLEQLGYVKRMRRENDRRSYVLSITPAGRNVLDAVMSFLPKRDAVLLGAITNDERKVLVNLLTRIVLRSRSEVKALQKTEPAPRAVPRKTSVRNAALANPPRRKKKTRIS